MRGPRNLEGIAFAVVFGGLFAAGLLLGRKGGRR
jgi:hypothetical protein